MKKILLSMIVTFVLWGVSISVFASVPEPNGPTPNSRQLEWQTRERIAFMHFGVNTFTDREWGTGNEDPNVFQPGSEYDPEQWVRVLKENGFELIILTAKHHDGFCLWPSAYTDHDVASSSWKNGQGDVLKDLSDACAKYNMKLGLYLSPWDRHDPSYGQGEAYNTFFKNQLREILTNYGTISEMWFDGAKDSNVNQDYDTDSWYTLIHELQPECVLWGDNAEVRWTGNERGIGGDPCWSRCYNPKTAADEGLTQDEINKLWQNGHPSGNIWYPAEADVSIRPGWFYHASQDNHIKQLDTLVDIYKKSVGRNNVLLLNVPPDRRGLIHENDVARLEEFNNWVEESFSNNLNAKGYVSVSNVRENDNTFSGQQLVDDNFDTYWATDDNVTTGEVIVDYGKVITLNTFLIQEYITLGQRVDSFAIDIWKDDNWLQVADKSTIGYKRIISVPNMITNKIRLRIKSAQASPVISEFAAYQVGQVAEHQDPNKNFALGKNVIVSDTHSSYSGDNAVDGSLETRWATNDSISSCNIEIDLAESVEFNKVYIKQLQQRIGNYTIDYFNGREWKRAYTGSDLGEEEEIYFEKVSGNKLRLNILDRKGNLGPSIYEIGVYNEKLNNSNNN